MAEITERIEKQMEGTNLALAAVAEVLQKMDGRLAKEEQDAAANAQASAQLAKIARLGQESQDIIIEVDDFANAYEENKVTTTEAEVLPNKQLESLGSGCEESTN